MPRFKLSDESKQAALILTIQGHQLTFLKDAECTTEVDESTANEIRSNPELVEVDVLLPLSGKSNDPLKGMNTLEPEGPEPVLKPDSSYLQKKRNLAKKGRAGRRG